MGRWHLRAAARIGLWNPSLYSFATGHRSPVTPLNQVGTGNGLGVPDLARFAADLAR
jgi:hypothetical protein